MLFSMGIIESPSSRYNGASSRNKGSSSLPDDSRVFRLGPLCRLIVEQTLLSCCNANSICASASPSSSNRTRASSLAESALASLATSATFSRISAGVGVNLLVAASFTDGQRRHLRRDILERQIPQGESRFFFVSRQPFEGVRPVDLYKPHELIHFVLRQSASPPETSAFQNPRRHPDRGTLSLRPCTRAHIVPLWFGLRLGFGLRLRVYKCPLVYPPLCPLLYPLLCPLVYPLDCPPLYPLFPCKLPIQR